MYQDESPSAVLRVLSPHAIELLGATEIPMDAFPFRFGRGEIRKRNTSTIQWVVEKMSQADQDGGTVAQATRVDCELPESRQSRYVSREHFTILAEGEQFFLVDEGSSLGTIVEGKLIGGKRAGGRTPLKHNDVVIVGSHHSGYCFKFQVRRRVAAAMEVK